MISAIIGLISLLLLALFIVSQIDINQFKKTIEIQTTEFIGRQINLDGDIHLELSLHPVLSIENVSVANASWSDKPQMLSLGRLYLKLDLMPIFDKQLVVEQLLLDDVDLLVETNTAGQINWQFEKFFSTDGDTDENAIIEKIDPEAFQLPFLPILKQVRINAVHFNYDDSKSDIHTNVNVENLQLSNLGISEAINFSANGSVNKHPFDFSGETRFLSAVTTQNVTEQGLKVKLNAKTPGITLVVEGEVKDPVAAEGISVAIFLNVDDLEKTFVAVTGKPAYQYIRKSNKPLSLNFSTTLTDMPDGYTFGTIKLNLAGNDLSGDMSFYNHPDRPEIIAKFKSRKIDINPFLAKKSSQKNTLEKNNKLKKQNTGIKLPETGLPFNLFKLLDADINYSIGEVQLEKFKPKAIKLNVSLKDGALKVKQFDLTLNNAPIRSSFIINSQTKIPIIAIKLDVDNLQISPVAQYLQFKQIKAGTLQSKINLKTKGNNIKSLVMNLKGRANVQLYNLNLEQQVKNKKHKAAIQQLSLNYFGMHESFKYDLNGKVDGEAVSLSGKLNSLASVINNDTLNLSINLNALRINIKADGNITSPLSADRAQFNVAIDIPEPKTSIHKIFRFIPDIKQNKNLASLPITIHGLLTASVDTYRFEKMQLKAGNNDLSGSIFADLRETKPFIDAKLESQLIDLNELVPATILETEAVRAEAARKTSATQQKKKISEKIRLFSSEPLPAINALDNLNVNLTYNLKKLTSNNQVIDDIFLNMTLKNSMLKLDPLSIEFAKGTIKSKLELSAITKLRFKLDTKITKLDYDRLMVILGTREYAKGELDADINLSGEGESIRALMASLNGMVRVTTVDGVLNSDSLKLLSKDLVSVIPFTDTSDRQKINCGVVQFNINKGIASVHSMVINTGAISALGAGSIDLANETLSLYISPRSKRTSVIDIVLVPVNITGSLVSPSVMPDLASAALSTTKTATNLGLAITTGGLWLLAGEYTNDIWDEFINNTDYCAKALAGEKIMPTRIMLESKDAGATGNTENDSNDSAEDGYETYDSEDDDW